MRIKIWELYFVTGMNYHLQVILPKNIYHALDHSEFLIVICTHDTPKSLWVEREISYFIEKHGRERMLIVLAEGTTEESVPKQLTTIYAEDGQTVLQELSV